MNTLPRRRHGRPVVSCPWCPVVFIGPRAHQDYADHSWDHTERLDGLLGPRAAAAIRQGRL